MPAVAAPILDGPALARHPVVRPTTAAGATTAGAAVPSGSPAASAAPVSRVQNLGSAQDTFIRRWGELGQAWGIHLTMGEIFAFLYVTGQPQCTDDVMARLNISRGNASMSLRALCAWGIVRRTHRPGERRDYFESMGDVWEMFSIIAAERKRRELDPVLEAIRQCGRMLEEPATGRPGPVLESIKITRRRLSDMEAFMEVANQLFQQFACNPRRGLSRVTWRRRGPSGSPGPVGINALGEGETRSAPSIRD